MVLPNMTPWSRPGELLNGPELDLPTVVSLYSKLQRMSSTGQGMNYNRQKDLVTLETLMWRFLIEKQGGEKPEMVVLQDPDHRRYQRNLFIVGPRKQPIYYILDNEPS